MKFEFDVNETHNYFSTLKLKEVSGVHVQDPAFLEELNGLTDFVLTVHVDESNEEAIQKVKQAFAINRGFYEWLTEADDDGETEDWLVRYECEIRDDAIERLSRNFELTDFSLLESFINGDMPDDLAFPDWFELDDDILVEDAHGFSNQYVRGATYTWQTSGGNCVVLERISPKTYDIKCLARLECSAFYRKFLDAFWPF